MPFTTPLLGGARARPAPRDGVELVIRSPSGGRGVYVLNWESVRALCQPTVHDHRLFEAVQDLPALTPPALRRISDALAAEGFAGQAARTAGIAAIKAERHERLLTHYLLLCALTAQADISIDGPRRSTARIHAEDACTFEQRARRAIAHTSSRTGRSPAAIAAALDALAGIVAPLGVSPDSACARVPAGLASLSALRSETEDWARRHDDDGRAALMTMAAAAAVSCGGAALAAARALLADPARLILHLEEAPDEVVQIAGRPEWVLDGWERICLLWRLPATDEERSALLAEMGAIIPAIPAEVSDWAGMATLSDRAAGLRRSHMIQGDDRRPAAATVDLIARNEKLRAMALEAEAARAAGAVAASSARRAPAHRQQLPHPGSCASSAIPEAISA